MHVIATAGHVDHGKSTLVRALTGMEPDRWEAERRRGMTIDLGFAWMTLPSGDQVAFVDVPGHERFVSNMLAGAGPAPAVMFVVAADEGWKPQSAEHLAAIDALGVRHGILVITRSDLADPGPALREAAGQIARTSLGRAAGFAEGDAGNTGGLPGPGAVMRLGGMDAVAVSAVDGRGIPELVAALGTLTGQLPRPDPRAGVRLWLDRVFAMKGSGTVVTGTLQAGTVRTGDELVLAPAMRPVRIRGVQSLGAPAGQVSGVARVALNLRGGSARELRRGMALIDASQWTVTSTIDVRLAAGSRGAPAARRGSQAGPPEVETGTDRLPPQLTLHIGTARTVARVRVLGDRLARLSLASPLPLHVGDRVLLRDPGAAGDQASGQPIYGATVLDVQPPRLRGTGAGAAARRELASWPEPPTAADLLRRHRLLRAGTASAMGLTGLPRPVSGDWLADPGHWLRLRDRLVSAVAAHAERDPLAAGLPVDAARAELGLPDRGLVEALATWRPDGAASEPLEMSGGYLRAGAARPAGQVPTVGEALEYGGGRGAEEAQAAEQTAQAGRGPSPAGHRPAGKAHVPGQARTTAGERAAGEAGTVGDGRIVGAGQSRAAHPSGSAGDGRPAARGPAGNAAPVRAAAAGLPGWVVKAAEAVLADLADAPFRAPDSDRLRELGLDARAAAAAERAGLLMRLSGNIVLAPGATGRAARILKTLPQPFTTAQARQALDTSRRVAIPLLEELDREGVTRRLPDDRRMMREP